MTKKLKINKEIKNKFSHENNISSISLKLEIDINSKVYAFDLSKHLNGDERRKKDLLAFNSFIVNTSRKGTTKKNLIKQFSYLLSTMDKCNNPIYFSDKSLDPDFLKKFKKILVSRNQDNKITIQSLKTIRSSIITVITECYGYDLSLINNSFSNFNQRTGKIRNPRILDSNFKERALSKDDLKELVLQLISISKYLNKNIDEDLCFKQVKENHYNKNKTKIQFSFGRNLKLKERQFNISTFCLLMVFISITGSNLSPAMLVRRKDIVIESGERDIINIKMTCYRKNKVQNHIFQMKKHQKSFFDFIIENSRKIDKSSNALLFPCIEDNGEIEAFYQDKIDKCYAFFKKNKIINTNDEEIKFNARKLRNSYASLFDNSVLRSEALFNSLKTASKNYSDGNQKENINSIQESMNIYTKDLTSKIDISFIDEDKKTNGDLKISSNGLVCSNSENSLAENKFKKKLNNIGFQGIESISCANVLACFYCKHALLSNNFETIYLLISLKNYLMDSIYKSESSGLFSNKDLMKQTLSNINKILNLKIDKKEKSKVEAFIQINGFHPLWEEL